MLNGVTAARSKIHFYKYQATGNDFVLVDNRDALISFTTSQIGKICDRRFGIGADGLILLGTDDLLDFKVVYYNADGTQSLCGNGCRSAINLASRLGLTRDGSTTFSAFDGPHDATIISDDLIKPWRPHPTLSMRPKGWGTRRLVRGAKALR